ncbi:hypothetical protein NDU88_003522 [Pleurodeles waltl]|uniref:Uncharacterized protein n=1 Tax=Pleurodeles waltl TaxID=8319 RepID=A0AAV7WSN6_PLEWA|nr:hypothetical protein NDU88_003522 [Pleurodeles waltl]
MQLPRLPVYTILGLSNVLTFLLKPLCREPRNNKGTHALSSENLLNQRRSEGPTQEEHVKKRRTQEVGANDFEMLNRNCHLEYISETQIEQGEPKSMKRSTQLLVYLSCKENAAGVYTAQPPI